MRESALRGITNGLEMYWLEAGHYPNSCGSLNTGCAISELSADLTPVHLSSTPVDPGPGQTMHYVVGRMMYPSVQLSGAKKVFICYDKGYESYFP